MNAKLLTLAEVAARLRVSHDTVYRLAASGKLAGTKVGRAWRFDGAAIEHLVALDSSPTEVAAEPFLQLEEQLDFRDLYENSPDMCLSVDAGTGRILCCNSTLLKTTGYDRSEVIGRRVDEIYHASCQSRANEILQQLRTKGEVRDMEMVVVTKSGGMLDVGLNLTAVRDSDGRILYSRSVWRDISQQKVRERRESLISSGWLESIAGDLADAVLVFDIDGQVVYMNDQAREFFRASPTDTLTRDELRKQVKVYSDDGKVLVPFDEWLCARALRGEATPPTEVEFRPNVGNSCHVRLRCKPLRDQAGNITGCVSVLHDIMADKQREQQLRLTQFSVEHSPDAIFWVRSDGSLAYVNERACQSLGYSREELLKLSVPDFDPDVSWEKWPDVWALVKSQVHFQLESRHRTKLGRVFPTEVLASYVQYDGAEYAVSHVRDISARRKVDAQLKESEARFQRAITASRDGIWDWDISADAMWLSPQYIQLFGYKPGELSPKHFDHWAESLHPDDKSRVMTVIEQHLAGVAPYDIEYRMRMKSGEYHWYRVRGQAYWNEDGVAVRMTGTTSDINEQRGTLEQLKHARQRKGMLIKHTPAAVAMFDREMRYIIHSDQWLKDYGLEGQSLIGRSHYEVFPDAPERWKQIHQECLQGHIRECRDDHFQRDDGSEVWLQWAIHPWNADDGSIGGIVMFTNVITDQKRTEKALQQARTDAEAANQAKSEFLANMSHEIRTPLTAILGFTEQLKEMTHDVESVDLCETIERNGAHLLELINDILDLSKVEAGRVDVVPEPYSPAQLACEIAGSLECRANEKQLSIAVQLAKDLPESCLLDVRRVRQILINLLGNAVKFTTHGAVTLEVHRIFDRAGEWLTFAVRDTGCGIPADKMSQLFEAFSQIDSSATRVQAGTGLGLCISRRLARLCGGDISVDSKLGAGSTFTLELPLVQSSRSPDRSRKRAANHSLTTASRQDIDAVRYPRLLVADDSPDIRRLLEFIFQRANFPVTFVENGQELVDRLAPPQAKMDFDAVILDMHMPVLDGYTVARLLRERGCSLPLIALTASAMESDREKCLEAGCNDFVTKPIHRQTLLNTVKTWVGQVGSTTATSR